MLKSELMTFSMYSNACPASHFQFQQNGQNLLVPAASCGNFAISSSIYDFVPAILIPIPN
jgi:hypothetical protein